MNWKRLLLVVSALVIAACHYDKPLGPAAGLEAPAGLVGRWKFQADPADNDKEDGFLVVHRTAEKRLVIDHQVSATEHWYFTGYPCLAGHPEIFELQFLGDSTGKPNTEKPFLIVRAKLDGDTLSWSTLDTDKLAPGDDAEAFRKALTAAVEKNADVFVKPQAWKREKVAEPK
ncbi:hypothetical protein [Luteolibacter sp. LG18]|uniref:hypothetical protein n=1 Tax=Luteolibacter sp. LG18 TaxID=2819286 RepID=UPI002B28FB0A|nr:hypothetical protein llg_09500 [Luteolibacter sp. LG18]